MNFPPPPPQEDEEGPQKEARPRARERQKADLADKRLEFSLHARSHGDRQLAEFPGKTMRSAHEAAIYDDSAAEPFSIKRKATVSERSREPM